MKKVLTTLVAMLSLASLVEAASNERVINFEGNRGEFFTYAQLTKLQREIGGESYEFVVGNRLEGKNEMFIGFYRTAIKGYENVDNATRRITAVCQELLKLNTPDIPSEYRGGKNDVWHNKETNKVSCMIFKKPHD